jgi:hypothetical protein
MKKLILSFLVISLLLAVPAAGQSKPHAARAFAISGKVSDDGKSLIGRNGEPWSVTNPGTLAGHEGQRVKVKCQISSGSHEIQVLSVRTVPTQARYTANPSDSAFRR